MSIEIEDGATDEEDTGQGWELGGVMNKKMVN
jgi:hypothetical protein